MRDFVSVPVCLGLLLCFLALMANGPVKRLLQKRTQLVTEDKDVSGEML